MKHALLIFQSNLFDASIIKHTKHAQALGVLKNIRCIDAVIEHNRL